MLIGPNYTLRSTDEGKTWILVDKAAPFGRFSGQGVVAALKVKSSDESYNQDQSTNIKYQFYVGDNNGIRRSMDSGDSWKRLNTGLGGKIQNLTVFNNKLYAVADDQLITSTDGGQSWKAIPVKLVDEDITLLGAKGSATHLLRIQQIVKADGILYAKGYVGLELNLFRLDEESRTLLPIQGISTLGERDPITAFMNAVKTSVEDDENGSSNLQGSILSMGANIFGAFAVSGNTFYVEHGRKLLIRHSSSQVNNGTGWYDTKIEDARDITDLTSFNSFKLGVSGDTVYVGKPDGVLLHSVDRGKSWKTVLLPIPIDSFKQILITDEAVYVTTDKGALYSSDGTKWDVITNLDGQQLMFDRFAMDGPTLYAVSSSKNAQGGVYRLTSANSTWERITPEVIDNVTSIAVAGSTLYVGTENGGLQLIGLEDFSHTPLTKH